MKFENILGINVQLQSNKQLLYVHLQGSGRDLLSCSSARSAAPLPQTSYPQLKWLKGRIPVQTCYWEEYLFYLFRLIFYWGILWSGSGAIFWTSECRSLFCLWGKQFQFPAEFTEVMKADAIVSPSVSQVLLW